MRADGVTNFPDPAGNGVGLMGDVMKAPNGQPISINGVSFDSPAFRSALASCHPYIPQQPAPTPAILAQARADAIAYGRCMRGHGIDIPDPRVATGPNGRGIGREIDIPQGMTQNSPAFVRADHTCERDWSNLQHARAP
jgi:hypothetical protein